MQEQLFWRVEKACRDAWPARRETQARGWLLRVSGGTTRRTNSLNPTENAQSISKIMSLARQTYGAAGRPVLFRLPTFLPSFETELSSLGFAPDLDPDSKSCTLLASLEACAGAGPKPDVLLEPTPSPDWIAARTRLSPTGREQEKAYEAMLGRIGLPVCFASISEGGAPVSLAYGAIDAGLLVIESVVTADGHRGKGLAAQTVAALMAWAQATGATQACLQVLANNPPVHALYAKLGFSRELYRYHYWRDMHA